MGITVNGSQGQEYTTQLPTTTQEVTGPATTAPVTQTGTTAVSADGVDTSKQTTAANTGLGQPKVTGGTSYDPNLGATTLQDVGTVRNVLGATQGSDLDTLLAKLLIAFNNTDKNSADELVAIAKERQKAETAVNARKAEQLAELMDAASGPRCLAHQRTEAKLEEMGYSHEQAHAMAKEMTSKRTCPGQQAVLALHAVENAPGAAGRNGLMPANRTDKAGAAQRKAMVQEAEAEAKMMLLKLLIASRSRGIDDGLAAAGQKQGQQTAAAPATTPTTTPVG